MERVAALPVFVPVSHEPTAAMPSSADKSATKDKKKSSSSSKKTKKDKEPPAVDRIDKEKKTKSKRRSKSPAPRDGEEDRIVAGEQQQPTPPVTPQARLPAHPPPPFPPEQDSKLSSDFEAGLLFQK